MTIWCASDLHGNWGPLAMRAREFDPGDWLLLLGDLDLVRPLGVMVHPLISRGVNVRWVAGNHDLEDGPLSYGFLREEAESAPWELHCRVEVMNGLRVAGLSGTYCELNAGRNPYEKREDYLRNDELPRHLQATIFHEDIDRLLALGGVDVIVSHEAPTDHAELEVLADALKCKHGHHHRENVNFMMNGGMCRCIEAERPWLLRLPDPETGL